MSIYHVNNNFKEESTMENRTMVNVTYGEAKYCSDEVSINEAMTAAVYDAKIRLLSEFPEAEDIEVETSICTDNDSTKKISVKAYAFGYIPKSNESHSHFIKDITTTVLYKSLVPSIVATNETVVAYKIRYMHMEMNLYRGGHYVEFSGKGDIPWKKLKDAINNHNQEVINSGFKNDCFVIEPDNLYKDLHLSEYAWSGFILLSDGSWLKLNKKYDSYLDKKYIGIDRKYPPNLDNIPDSNFKVTICNKGNMN